jgi:hypothetical protein
VDVYRLGAVVADYVTSGVLLLVGAGKVKAEVNVNRNYLAGDTIMAKKETKDTVETEVKETEEGSKETSSEGKSQTAGYMESIKEQGETEAETVESELTDRPAETRLEPQTVSDSEFLIVCGKLCSQVLSDKVQSETDNETLTAMLLSQMIVAKFDYETLLKKYINQVMTEEGTSYISAIPYMPDSIWTQKEIDEMKRLEEYVLANWEKFEPEIGDPLDEVEGTGDTTLNGSETDECLDCVGKAECDNSHFADCQYNPANKEDAERLSDPEYVPEEVLNTGDDTGVGGGVEGGGDEVG